MKNQSSLYAWFCSLILILGMFIANPEDTRAQSYDLLLKGGHVMDPKNGIDEPMDIAIHEGTIVRVAPDIPAGQAELVADVRGLYVMPGLIDLHAHHYWGTEPGRYLSDSFTALPPDGFTFRSGVTTAVDVGGAGWKNFGDFKEQVIDRSQTRILSFINIVGDGMSGLPEQNIEDMNPRMTVLTAERNDEVVGIKIAHFQGYNWEPYRRTVEAGEKAGIPVMIDLGPSDEPLPLDTLFFDILRPGDLFTHAYGNPIVGSGFKEAAVDEDGVLRPHWKEAQERGILFDVGHGGWSFLYDIAKPATEQGLWPDIISTDLHTDSMNAGLKNLANLMSKFLNLGMPLFNVVEASTLAPARVIDREDLGHLGEGAVADIAVFNLREGEFGFIDAVGVVEEGTERLETELTISGGRVVYDLNGIATERFR